LKPCASEVTSAAITDRAYSRIITLGNYYLLVLHVWKPGLDVNVVRKYKYRKGQWELLIKGIVYVNNFHREYWPFEISRGLLCRAEQKTCSLPSPQYRSVVDETGVYMMWVGAAMS